MTTRVPVPKGGAEDAEEGDRHVTTCSGRSTASRTRMGWNRVAPQTPVRSEVVGLGGGGEMAKGGAGS